MGTGGRSICFPELLEENRLLPTLGPWPQTHTHLLGSCRPWRPLCQERLERWERPQEVALQQAGRSPSGQLLPASALHKVARCSGGHTGGQRIAFHEQEEHDAESWKQGLDSHPDSSAIILQGLCSPRANVQRGPRMY